MQNIITYICTMTSPVFFPMRTSLSSSPDPCRTPLPAFRCCRLDYVFVCFHQLIDHVFTAFDIGATSDLAFISGFPIPFGLLPPCELILLGFGVETLFLSRCHPVFRLSHHCLLHVRVSSFSGIDVSVNGADILWCICLRCRNMIGVRVLPGFQPTRYSRAR